MSIAVVFDLPGTREEQYAKVAGRLAEQGLDAPDGRLLHLAGPKRGGGWFMLDVWESEQAYDEFAKALLPLIDEAGIFPPMPPQVVDVQALVEGTPRSPTTAS